MGVVTTLAERAFCSEGETRKLLNFLDPLFVEGTMFNSNRAIGDDQERGKSEKKPAEKKQLHGKKRHPFFYRRALPADYSPHHPPNHHTYETHSYQTLTKN